jgi:DNA-binding response OmpR family regulator
VTGPRGLVLVVEDEPSIADLLRLYLTREGFRVVVETDGPSALDTIRAQRPVAVVLDVGLPTMDGTEVLRRLRAGEDWTPVLLVTARDDELDRLLGLELGADDYVTKPFSPREVVARVRTVLRRAAGTTPATRYRLGTVELDRSRRTVTAGDRAVTLTTTEFDLLATLLRSPGRVFTRDELLAGVWGYSSAAGTRTVDVHVAQLRAKLGAASPVRTVRGVGYSADVATGGHTL